MVKICFEVQSSTNILLSDPHYDQTCDLPEATNKTEAVKQMRTIKNLFSPNDISEKVRLPPSYRDKVVREFTRYNPTMKNQIGRHTVGAVDVVDIRLIPEHKQINWFGPGRCFVFYVMDNMDCKIHTFHFCVENFES